MKSNEMSKTRVGERIRQRMEEKNKSIRELSKDIDVVYETIRGFVTGNTVPSPHILKEICEVLGLNFKEMKTLRVSDEITRKHGVLPPELSKKNPELDPLERLWPKLSEEHKSDLIAMAKTYAHRDSA